MIKAISFIFLILTSVSKSDDIVLENNNIKVLFCSKSGAIKEFVSKKTGWQIERRPKQALSFYMNIPLPNQRFNPVLGSDQRLDSVRIIKKEKKLIFTWSQIKSAKGGKLDILFEATAQLKDDGLYFNAIIENNSPYTIESVRWPQLGDLSIPDKSTQFNQIGIDYGGMDKFEIYPKFQNEPGYFAVDNPSNWMEYPATPFVLLCDENEGLYVGYHDTSASQLVQFKTELKPGYLSYELWDTGVNPVSDTLAGQPVRYEFSTVHFPFINPGDKVHLNQIVMQPYKGNWQDGSDNYKKWRAQWFNPPFKPDWLQNVNSWQQIHLNNPEDDIRYNYSDLVELGEECAENDIRAIQITGWTKGGQDKDNPSHDIDPRLGNYELFRDVITEIKEMGVKVILFTKFTWADRSTDWYKSELNKYTMKDPYGEPYYHNGYAYQTDVQLAEINTHHFSPLCHLSEEWRNIANKEFEKTISLGADGMLFDENQHHGGAKYCFDKTHDHHIPDFIIKGDELLAEGFSRIRNKKNPNYIFGGEGNYDLEFRHYPVSYFRVDLDHIPIHRYIAPDEEMMIAVAGYNDRNMINTALLYRYIISYEPRNFKGRLSEFPKTLEYGKKVDSLRKLYDRFLWKGEIQNHRSANILVNGNTYDKYSIFLDKESGKKAIVIANFNYNDSLTVEIKFRDKSKHLIKVSPENRNEVESSGTEIILPNSAIVIFEK